MRQRIAESFSLSQCISQVNAGVGEVAKVFLNPARTNITSTATTPASNKEAVFAASASASSIAVGGTAVAGLEALPSPTLTAALRGSPVFDTTAVGIATVGEDSSPTLSTPATVNVDALKQEKIQQELVLKLKVRFGNFHPDMAPFKLSSLFVSPTDDADRLPDV